MQREELEQARLEEIQRVMAHDQSYTSKEGTMIPVPLQHPATRELDMCKLAPYENQPGYQQLVNNEHEDGSEERLNETCAELLEGYEDVTTTLGIFQLNLVRQVHNKSYLYPLLEC